MLVEGMSMGCRSKAKQEREEPTNALIPLEKWVEAKEKANVVPREKNGEEART